MRAQEICGARDQMEIAAELVHELDADGKQLRVVKLTDYTVPRSRERERVVADRVRVVGDKTLHSAEKVRTLCASPDELRVRWADAGQRAFSLSASTGERAGVRCRTPQRTTNLVAVRKHLPYVLKLPPISHHCNVNEIIGKFGGADQLRTAVNQLQSLLYAV